MPHQRTLTHWQNSRKNRPRTINANLQAGKRTHPSARVLFMFCALCICRTHCKDSARVFFFVLVRVSLHDDECSAWCTMYKRMYCQASTRRDPPRHTTRRRRRRSLAAPPSLCLKSSHIYVVIAQQLCCQQSCVHCVICALCCYVRACCCASVCACVCVC